MPEFSACYFCGTALDAPLAEYPVVPDTLHPAPDQQRTVVLCPTCRRKVGAVVDAVVDALDDAPEDATVQRELNEANGNGAASPETGAIDARRLDDGDPTGEDAAAEDPLVESGDADPDSGGPETETGGSEPERGRDGTVDDAGGFEFEGDAAEQPADEAASTTEETRATDQERASADAGGPAEEGVDGRPAGEGADAGAGDEDADAGAGVEDADGPDAEPEMTALEYNKVMRLLQNRDFPVDREEFKVVATNAYQLSESEFESVIAAAEKRGLIGVEGGQIVEG